jgi:SNF5 / SMARCB1 / INI1
MADVAASAQVGGSAQEPSTLSTVSIHNHPHFQKVLAKLQSLPPASTPRPALIPIRIDATVPAVSSTTSPIRFVDTLLFDPTVWPIPRSSIVLPAEEVRGDLESQLDRLVRKTTQEWILQNAEYLARTMISDIECFHVVRTTSIGKNYSGRLDPLQFTQNLPLLTAVTTQIQQQLTTIFKTYGFMSSTTTSEPVEMSATKSGPGEDQNVQGAGCSAPERDQTQFVKDALNAARNESRMFKIKLRCSSSTASGTLNIHDEFIFDPTVPNVNPIVVAQSIGQDLNLPQDAVVMLASEISEQIASRSNKKHKKRAHGTVESDNDSDSQDDNDESKDPAKRQKRRFTTAAWIQQQQVIDGKQHSARLSKWMQYFGPGTSGAP